MGWLHLEDSTPGARKRHRFFLCREPIEPGETYVRRTGVNSDGLMPFAMHPEREAATKGWGEDEWETFAAGDGFARPREGVEGGRAEQRRPSRDDHERPEHRTMTRSATPTFAPAGAFYACRAFVGSLDVVYVSPDRDRVVWALRRLLAAAAGRARAFFGSVEAASPEEARDLALARGSRWAWAYFPAQDVDDEIFAAIGLAQRGSGDPVPPVGDAYRIGASPCDHDATLVPGDLYGGYAWGEGTSPARRFVIAVGAMAEFREAIEGAGTPPPGPYGLRVVGACDEGCGEV